MAETIPGHGREVLLHGEKTAGTGSPSDEGQDVTDSKAGYGRHAFAPGQTPRQQRIGMLKQMNFAVLIPSWRKARRIRALRSAKDSPRPVSRQLRSWCFHALLQQHDPTSGAARVGDRMGVELHPGAACAGRGIFMWEENSVNTSNYRTLQRLAIPAKIHFKTMTLFQFCHLPSVCGDGGRNH